MLTKTAIALGATCLSLIGAATAQDVPFIFNGAFEGASASSDAYNSGGTLTVSGRTVDVPKNLQVQFPAAFIGFKEFAEGSGAYSRYNIEVTGNVVGGKHIAAQVSMAQFMLEGASGYVESVEFDGSIKLRGGPTLRISDPDGVYSTGFKGHPFFTADDENPSITAFSGFPMCVPRKADDEKCPQSNRPVVTGTKKQGTFKAPDPLVMAPIVPGDFIEYSGIQGANGEHIIYSAVVSNVQITTTGVPTYIRMEDAIIGVWTDNTATQEMAQIRFIGVTSDGSGNVNPLRIYAMDVDPCTGKITDREIGSTPMITGQARNKFEYRIKAPQNSEKTREYRIVAGTGTRLTKNGILAGQYIQPVTEWIQPEATTPGLEPFPNDFSSMPFLTKGLGYDEAGNLWGPLSPFPQSGVTTSDPSKCAPFVPPAPENPGGGDGTPTNPPTSTTSTAAPPSNTPITFKDTVTMPTLNWQSSQSGTLSVNCRSNVTDSTVSMKLSYTNQNGETSGVVMANGGSGLWTFSGRSIKRPTIVTCKSGLGGTISRVP